MTDKAPEGAVNATAVFFGCTYQEAADYLRELSTDLPAPSRIALAAVLCEGTGSVVVPREATEAMLKAGDRNSGMTHFLVEMFDEDRQQFVPALQLAYEAMLAAAPPTTDTEAAEKVKP